ncbi:class I histocompatibility antigen, F10 alpha chain-like isoform X2 [Hyla sarda]|uniref:class I histocompatibility antigen, F10 alpha chain-like isoform X2 n=1 Tax=Hyla sarda TaxID=327740 RepID=UPI0024C33CA2|nr:class I histocompatibility antigen, F10 alpha chain-like isoform X2 [Hyla sarda]
MPLPGKFMFYIRYMEKSFTLTLILLSMPGVYSDSHSLRYVYTGVTTPGYGMSEFSKFGYVDDQLLEFYTTDIGRTVPVASWWKKENPELWEKKTRTSKANVALFRHEVKFMMKRFNHTEGLHVVQVMHTCGLRDDGSTVGDEQFQYDGREYMYLDVQTATYFPSMAEAQITTERWNRPDIRAGVGISNYLVNECIERLRRYIVKGREDLERRVRPGVKVTGLESGKVTKLHCWVYGFHPRAVDVKWMKNKVDDVPTYDATRILPNPDGTYQIRVTAEVIPQEGNSYSCYVDHSSLEEPLYVKWEPRQHSAPAVIISVVVFIILLLSFVIAGVLIYKKKNDTYTAARTLDTSPDTSHQVNEEACSL